MLTSSSTLKRSPHGSTKRGNSVWESFKNPSRISSLYRRFPTTMWIATPYLILFLPPAFLFGNPGKWFLVKVAAIALMGTFIVDLLMSSANQRAVYSEYSPKYGRPLFLLAFTATSISTLISVAASFLGKGSVAAQTGAISSSAGFIGILDSLTNHWAEAGVGLAVAAGLFHACSKGEMVTTILIAVTGSLITAYNTQITNPLFSRIAFIAFFLLLFGLIRFRTILIGIAITLVAWGPIFEIRNQLRTDAGVYVSEIVTAYDRIRFDLQFAKGQELPSPLEVYAPGILQNPTPLDILQYGFVPRFLNPDRDIVSTGHLINIALGGSETSAYTFGPITTLYVLEGAGFVFLYYAAIALFINIIWNVGNYPSPVQIMILALALSGPIGWFSTQPDALIAFFQSLVASVPLLIALAFIRRTDTLPSDLSRSKTSLIAGGIR